MTSIGKIDWGSFVGAGALALLAVALLAGAALLWRWHGTTMRGGDGDWGMSLAFTIGMVVCAIPALFGAFYVLWPFDWDYLSWHRVDGKVEQVASRQVSDGKAMSQRFVLVIDGRPYGVDDTRAALVKAGESVTLACKKEYQYAAESGWACNWGAP